MADRVPPALRDCVAGLDALGAQLAQSDLLLRKIVDLATNLGNASPQAEANIE